MVRATLSTPERRNALVPADRVQWRWRFVSANGKIIADGSEGYNNISDCVQGINLVMRTGRDPLIEFPKSSFDQAKAIVEGGTGLNFRAAEPNKLAARVASQAVRNLPKDVGASGVAQPNSLASIIASHGVLNLPKGTGGSSDAPPNSLASIAAQGVINLPKGIGVGGAASPNRLASIIAPSMTSIAALGIKYPLNK
jgi:uncharacterized protein YegP (UPF0339 family)